MNDFLKNFKNPWDSDGEYAQQFLNTDKLFGLENSEGNYVDLPTEEEEEVANRDFKESFNCIISPNTCVVNHIAYEEVKLLPPASYTQQEVLKALEKLYTEPKKALPIGATKFNGVIDVRLTTSTTIVNLNDSSVQSILWQQQRKAEIWYTTAGAISAGWYKHDATLVTTPSQRIGLRDVKTSAKFRNVVIGIQDFTKAMKTSQDLDAVIRSTSSGQDSFIPSLVLTVLGSSLVVKGLSYSIILYDSFQKYYPIIYIDANKYKTR